MFTITTTLHSTPTNGTGKVTAKGHGKQRTVPFDHSLSGQANSAAAVGALLNVLCDDRQKAMLRHPSAKQRLRDLIVDTPKGMAHRWTIDV